MRFTGLWLHIEFRKLWGGQASSLLGTQAVYLILPLTAVIVLEATPFQMGIVSAMEGVPAIAAIFFGVWVDRHKRLPIIVSADVGRGLLLMVVPIAHLLDLLTIEVIYFVAFGIGLMSILFQIAYRPFLAAVVEPDQIVDANSKLELAGSATSAVGPGVGGVLVQAVTAPFAMFFGAGSYFLSAVLFKWIRVTEDEDQLVGGNESGLDGIREGFAFFRRNSILLGLATSQLTLLIFASAWGAVGLLYLVRELDLNAGTIGLIAATGSIGSFLGASMAPKLESAIGVGRTMSAGLMTIALVSLMVPLAGGPQAAVIAILVFAYIAGDAGNVNYAIGLVSLRLAVTPDRLGGRITSILVISSRLGLPIGGLLGGVLGELIGLRETLFVGAAGMGASSLWLVYFGVWRVKSVEEFAGEAGDSNR